VINRYGTQLTSALTLVVLTCVGIRAAYWLLAPTWPLLVVLVFLILIINMILRNR